MRLPGALHLVPQRDAIPDCSVACLATYLGLQYERVLAVAVQVNPRVLATGLSDHNIKRVAAKFDSVLRRTRTVDFEESSGILGCTGMNHVVVLWKGLIFELRDSTVWTPEDYLTHHKAKAGRLLTAETS